MEGHAVTFERLEADYELGPIRSIDVDHTTRRIYVVCDDKSKGLTEGGMVRQVGSHTLDGSRLEP